ncbi:MAG: hypothetical protein RLZZ385_1429 [Pseudomonadota bacterium]|jgi:RimJ/RimL family protein N-acetyltransferase
MIFETPRLTCRLWQPSDLSAIYELYSDPLGARWVGDGQPITLAECERWLQVTATNYRIRGYGMFALDDKSSGRLVGCCGLVHPGGQAEAEIKYAFLRDFWGRGLATEVVPALLEYAAYQHGLKRVIATVAPENLGSRRVLEKSGLLQCAEQRDDNGEQTLVYEWLAVSKRP